MNRCIGLVRGFAIVLAAIALSACVTVPPATRDYTAFRTEAPRSILIVPALNNTVNVQAPDFFISTISRPFSERGYYVFPAYMIKKILESEGLSDAGLVHGVDARRLRALFGCDTVLFVTIDQWQSQYVILATQTTVSFTYALKSCKTGDVLWSDTQTMVYSPRADSSGNPLADLLAQAILAAVEKGAPNYIPLAMQANAAAAGTPGRGLPPGPYLPTDAR